MLEKKKRDPALDRELTAGDAADLAELDFHKMARTRGHAHTRVLHRRRPYSHGLDLHRMARMHARSHARTVARVRACALAPPHRCAQEARDARAQRRKSIFSNSSAQADGEPPRGRIGSRVASRRKKGSSHGLLRTHDGPPAFAVGMLRGIGEKKRRGR